MKRILTQIIFLFFTAAIAHGQQAQTPQSFEAADVRSSPKSVNPNVQTLGGFVRAGRYQFRNATMVDLIASAYGVDGEKVLGGPFWLETDRFDILAKAPTNATQATARLMLRSLLADRFKLTIHNEDKQMSAWVMTASKPGPQLKQAAAGGPTNCNGQPEPPNTVLICKNITMAVLAQAVRQLDAATFDTPVTDMTGLEGGWDFQLTFTNRGALPTAGKDAIPILEAVEKQLGIKIEQQKRGFPTLVVDSVNRKPTDNVPGIDKLVPVVATEFEVADLKPSAPNSQLRGGIQPGGRIDLQGLTLKQLLLFSTGLVAPNQNPTQGNVSDLMSGPKFMDTEHYDIVARAPADVALNGTDVDADTILAMLRTLLIDRFKIKYHTEDQPINVYALISVKRDPRLKAADPNSRSTCKRTVANNPSGLPTATLTCQNTTLAQLAERLPAMAPAYVDHPALDVSGLDGGWDFALSWTPRANFDGGQRGETPGGAAAAEPNGALSLFEGVERLGLKLEVRKLKYPVLVIDHIEQKPTEN